MLCVSVSPVLFTLTPPLDVGVGEGQPDPPVIVIERNNSWAAQLESDRWSTVVENWPSGINVWPVNGQRNGQLSNSGEEGNYTIDHKLKQQQQQLRACEWGRRRIKIVAGKLAINWRSRRTRRRRTGGSKKLLFAVNLLIFFGLLFRCAAKEKKLNKS